MSDSFQKTRSITLLLRSIFQLQCNEITFIGITYPATGIAKSFKQIIETQCYKNTETEHLLCAGYTGSYQARKLSYSFTSFVL